MDNTNVYLYQQSKHDSQDFQTSKICYGLVRKWLKKIISPLHSFLVDLFQQKKYFLKKIKLFLQSIKVFLLFLFKFKTKVLFKLYDIIRYYNYKAENVLTISLTIEGIQASYVAALIIDLMRLAKKMMMMTMGETYFHIINQ